MWEQTELIREWEYGLYEGKLTSEIKAMRAVKGLDTDTPWTIWAKGCEEGESPSQVQERIDGKFDKIFAFISLIVVKSLLNVNASLFMKP